MTAATGWQAHSVRGATSGSLKKLGFSLPAVRLRFSTIGKSPPIVSRDAWRPGEAALTFGAGCMIFAGGRWLHEA